MPGSARNEGKNLLEDLQKKKRELENAVHNELAAIVLEDNNHRHEAYDTADRSSADVEETLEVKLIDIRKGDLDKMREAERKLREGTYGICDICGDKISKQRLSAMPFAIHCLKCAEKVEGDSIRGKGPTL